MTSSVGRPRPVQLLSLFMSGALYKCFLFLWAAPPPDMILFFPAALAACFYFRLPPLRADACLPDYCNIKRRKCLSKTGVCGDGDCENCVFLPFICQNRGGYSCGGLSFSCAPVSRCAPPWGALPFPRGGCASRRRARFHALMSCRRAENFASAPSCVGV